MTPTPICAFDIFSNGTAQTAPDTHPKKTDGATYRWLHFDLETEGLETWCEMHLPNFATRSILSKRTRPRVDEDDTGMVLTLRGINLNTGAEVEDMVSLRIWATADLVVSVRRLRIFAMDELRDQIAQGDAPPTPARLVARVCANLVEKIENFSLDLEDRADTMETRVYEDDNLDIPDLAPLRRTVITTRRHLAPLTMALSNLAQVKSDIMPKSMRNRLRDIASRAHRSLEEINEVVERLHALSDHIELSQNTRLNRNSYLLSVVAAIFLPLGFLTGLFGVNVGGMPGVAAPHAFAFLTGGMVVLGIILYAIFRLFRLF